MTIKNYLVLKRYSFLDKTSILRKNVGLVLLACLIFGPVHQGFTQVEEEPEEHEVLVRAEAPIYDGDKFRAREEASAMAKRNAVEQAIGTLVTSETRVENFELISDKILTKASGYIKRFEILKETDRGDSLLIVAKAVVTVATVKDDLIALNLLQAAIHKPRIMLLFAGEGLARPAADAIRTELSKGFLKKEFNLVEPPKSGAEVKAALAAATSGDVGAIAKMGAQLGAEVVITGVVKATSKDMGEDYAGMISCSVAVGIQAIRASNGKVLSSQPLSGKTIHITKEQGVRKAAIEAAKKVFDPLLEDLVAVWTREISQGETIQVRLKNISYNQLVKLENEIRKLRGVTDLHERNFDGNAKMGIVDVDYRGETRTLAQDLSKFRIGGRDLNIISVKPGRVDLSLASKKISSGS